MECSSDCIAANSTAIVNNIVNLYGNGRLHPDFGQDSHTATDLYGIPYNVVHGNSTPKTTVVIDAYADESDVVPLPIPANAILEGDYQNGPKPVYPPYEFFPFTHRAIMRFLRRPAPNRGMRIHHQEALQKPCCTNPRAASQAMAI